MTTVQYLCFSIFQTRPTRTNLKDGFHNSTNHKKHKTLCVYEFQIIRKQLSRNISTSRTSGIITYSIINTASLVIYSTFLLITKNRYNLLQLLKLFLGLLHKELNNQNLAHDWRCLSVRGTKHKMPEKLPHHQDSYPDVDARPTCNKLS